VLIFAAATITGTGLNMLEAPRSNRKVIIGVVMVGVVALDMWDKKSRDQ
jgi:ribose/xylose/arabinose/galactoside ABC-type transport system permease subunit